VGIWARPILGVMYHPCRNLISVVQDFFFSIAYEVVSIAFSCCCLGLGVEQVHSLGYLPSKRWVLCVASRRVGTARLKISQKGTHCVARPKFSISVLLTFAFILRLTIPQNSIALYTNISESPISRTGGRLSLFTPSTMPTAKRLKSSGKAKAQPAAKKNQKQSKVENTPAAEADEDTEFAKVAKKHWLKSGKRSVKVKVKNDVLKNDIWDPLEKEGFAHKALLVLESLQTLERYASSPRLRHETIRR
jgi:hypothetical protein